MQVISEPPQCWTTVFKDNILNVIFVSDRNLITLNEKFCHIVEVFDASKFQYIAVSPKQSAVAFYGKGELSVAPISLEKIYSRVNLEIEEKDVSSIVWCGSDCICLNLGTLIVLVSPLGNQLPFYYTDAVEVFNETDGLKVLTKERLEFIDKIVGSRIFKCRSFRACVSIGICFVAGNAFRCVRAFSERELKIR